MCAMIPSAFRRRGAAALVALAFVLLASFAPAFAQDNPVSVRLEIFVVSVVDGEERYTAATTARPGQVVEYRLFASNVGDTTLPPGTVVLTGPVPEGTAYVANSATPSSDRLLTEYTADGGVSFDETLIFIGEGDDRRLADPAQYTAVRWTLLVDIEPAAEEAFFYRVTVE
jgi:uncharacterized repeat protein (TIGR01451 family)